MLSAVRLPTPPPPDAYPINSFVPRKRSPPSRSPSPIRKRQAPTQNDYIDTREQELTERFRKREAPEPRTEEEKNEAAKKEYTALLGKRSGGVYLAPARLRALQAQISDKSSKEYQRMVWEALKKAINGNVNKVNTSNIKHLVGEVFSENILRGRGLFCQSIMRAAAASTPFIPIYASLVAIVNTKIPLIGELLIARLISQFKKAFKRNDKAVCLSSVAFLAQLSNFSVLTELIPAQILLLLLNRPTNDSTEIAVGLMRAVGQHLEAENPPIANAVFDQFRSILNEGDVDKRVQYQIEVLFQIRKNGYRDDVAVPEDLDLVEDEDIIVHSVNLDDDFDTQLALNVFKYDPEYEENEQAYQSLKAEILGEEASGLNEDDDDSGSDESSENEDEKVERDLEIKDQTNQDLVNLRRTIYLTIMSSSAFEEATHKLSKINLPAGLEHELPSMIIECCSQERTYTKFYGLMGERFSKLNRQWAELFQNSFVTYYETIHRYESSKIRNIAKFFGHLLSTDGISWACLSAVHLNEDETTSSSRIYIKILFQDLSEQLGMKALQSRLKDDMFRQYYQGIFPMDNAKNTRFSINYFTSIGMGGLTEDMREHLKTVFKPPATIARPKVESASEDSASSYSSYSSYTGSSRSYSRSPSPSPKRGNRPRDDSPGPRRRRCSSSRSRTPPRRDAPRIRRQSTPSSRGKRRARSFTPLDMSRSRSPPRRATRRRSPSYSSRSRTPPPRRGRYQDR